MARHLILTGTLRKAHHADPAQSAFGIYCHGPVGGSQPWPQPAPVPTEQPGWLVLSRDNTRIHALNEVRDFAGEPGGGITTFALDHKTGALTQIGACRTGASPCHGAIDATGSLLIVATFHGGTVHMYAIDDHGIPGEERAAIAHCGSSIHPTRQTAPHPHGVAISPDNRMVLVPDLGTDRVEVYHLDAAASTLQPWPEAAVQMPAGSGPRHACFDASGKIAYVINEMSASIAVLKLDGHANRPRLDQIVPLLPADFDGLRSGGELAVRADQRFVYATTRSHGSSGMPARPGLDAVHWLAIDQTTGNLALAGSRPTTGAIPRAFCFDASHTGLWIAHQCSSTLSWHPTDNHTGAVGAAHTVLDSPVPVCVHTVPVD